MRQEREIATQGKHLEMFRRTCAQFADHLHFKRWLVGKWLREF